MENLFCEYLKKVKPTNDFIKLFDKGFVSRYQERIQEIKGDYLRKLDDIKNMETEQEWLVQKGRKGIIPENLLEKQLKELEQKITLAKIGLSDIHAEELDSDALLNYGYAFIRTIDLVWYDALPQARIKYQRLIFPEGVTFDGKVFSNQRLGLPFKLINDIATIKSTDVDPRGIEPLSTPCHGVVLPVYYGPQKPNYNWTN